MPPKRSKGVTFKLVHPSYDDATYDETKNVAVMVEEKQLRRHLPSTASSWRRGRDYNNEDDYDYDDCGDCDPANVGDLAREWTTTTTTAATAATSCGRLPEEEAYMNRHNFLRAQDDDDDENNKRGNDGDDEEDDDLLFDDQEEVEFTDDFLREVVFGDGDDDGDASPDYDNNNNNNNNNNNTDTAGGAAGHDDSIYAQHDATRGVDRQFARVMREFNVDARLNEAYSDDPRAHGALDVSQYMRALQEFVVDRAGVDYGTAEPLRNRGLIHQLKNMAFAAGTDMGPGGELHTTTVLPDKQTRFLAELQRGAEEIRRAARQRVEGGAQLERPAQGDTAGSEGHAEEEEGEEAYAVKEVRDKSNRLDCETVVSTYSTHFNQPNVIRAPPSGKHRKRHAASSSSGATALEHNTKQEEEESVPELTTHLVAFARQKGETKEEKKMRQQLIKQVQRERRSKKRELKQTYKALEVDEAKRSKESQTAKKTVHFF